MNIVALLLSIFLGISLGAIIFLIFSSDENYIEIRLNRTSNKNAFKSLLLAYKDIMNNLATRNIKDKVAKNKVEELLKQAGLNFDDRAILEFENKRLTAFLFVFILCAVLMMTKFNMLSISVSLLLLYLAYKMPEFKLASLIKAKQKEFLLFFPDAIDLLSVCVEAGLGVDSAIERVAQEFNTLSVAVSSEFSRLSSDVTSGLARSDALKNMASRVGTQDVRAFCAMLVQSDKMGTSVSQTLRTLCESIRIRRKQRIEELIQSTSSKMTIPMVLFLLPALFILLLYPAIVQILENM